MNKNNKISVILVFALFICISLAGSVSAADDNTTNNVTNNVTTDTGDTGLADSPYPTYQVNNNRTGQSDYDGPETNITEWNQSSVNIAVMGSDGSIYTGLLSGNVIKAYYPNGTLKWTITLPNASSVNTVRGLTIGNNGTLYVVAYQSLFAVNSSTGEILWTYNYTSTPVNTYSYPTIGENGTIYFGTTAANPTVYAINPNGTVKWTFTHDETVSSVSVGADGTIYVRTFTELYTGMIYALNPINGTSKWSVATKYGSGLSIGSDGTLYAVGSNVFGAASSSLYAINPDGTFKWTYNSTAIKFLGIPAIASDGTIYVGITGGIYALVDNVTGPVIKWIYNDSAISSTTSNIFNMLIGADGTLYATNGTGIGAGTRYGSIYALNPNGTLKWSYNSGYPASLFMLGSNKTLYAVDTSDKLVAFQDLVAGFQTSINGTTVTFTDNTTNLPTSWIWDFGDDNLSDEQNPVHTYNSNGAYTITLTVSTAYGDTTSTTQTILVGSIILNNRTNTTYTSIQSAINDANTQDGDTLTVNTGNYTENIIINKNLILNTLGLVTVTAADANNPVFSVTSNGSGSTINGFVITGANGSSAISLSSANNVTLTNNTILNNLAGIHIQSSANTNIQGNNLTNNTWAIDDENSQNTTINNNTISNNTNAVFLYQTSNSTVTGNKITNNYYNGIYLQNSTNNTIKNNTINDNGIVSGSQGVLLESSNNNNIQNNNIQNNGFAGILLRESSYNTIGGSNDDANTVSGNNNGVLIFSNSLNNTITENQIINNIYNGLWIFINSENNTINNNNITNNNETGLLIIESDNNNINTNTVNNNTFNGIVLTNSSNNTIQGNTANNNGNTIHFGGIGILLTQNANSNLISGNQVNGNLWTNIVLDTTQNNNITLNTVNGSNISQQGIFIENSQNTTINNNTITVNTANGVYISDSNNAILENNNISNNSITGALFSNTTTSTVYNNTFQNNGWTGTNFASSNNNTITHNNYIDNPGQAYDNSTNNYDNGTTGNYWSDWNNTAPRPIDGGTNTDNHPSTTPF